MATRRWTLPATPAAVEMLRRLPALALLAALVLELPTFPGRAAEHEIGGPLAGVRLPPWEPEFGEPPGHPGSLPEKMAAAETVQDGQVSYRRWGPQAQAPELELYPGSVEHYRAYMFKYLPIRSFFDRQSLLRRFPAPGIPGVEERHVESYAAPLFWVPRHDPPVKTDKMLKPVRVVRMKVEGPVLKLDLGMLDPGLYALRVIGAVEPGQVRPFRKPVFLRMTIDDGLEGERSSSRVRIGYCEEFYSVAELYFHALRRRAFAAELRLDKGSEADLLVHDVVLDDVLAGTERRAIKQRRIFRGGHEEEGGSGRYGEYIRQMQKPCSREERLARDEAIWHAFPPLNAQGLGSESVRDVEVGALDALDPSSGSWKHVAPYHVYGWFLREPKTCDLLLVNEKLGLAYTMGDLAERRPLPDPFPLKDDGAGLYRADAANPAAGKVYSPIADAVGQRYRTFLQVAEAGAEAYRLTGQEDFARDGAVALVRYAFGYPAIDTANFLLNLVHETGPYGRDYRCRRRETVAFWLPHYATYVQVIYPYDTLFDYIRGSQDLADSVRRFVPWVKGPQDVIQLLDVYLVQTLAKRILRYHYHTDPLEIAKVAAVLGDPAFTEPWMEWLFSRTFIYPLPPAGIQDAMITGCVREGTEYVASTFYAQEEGAKRVALGLEEILKAGGDPRYGLSDTVKYPKTLAHCYWQLDTIVGGWDFLRIGDVCGPDKRPGATFGHLGAAARAGWEWSKDPRFAYILKHHFGGTGEELEAAAATVRRAPWLTARSRVLPSWAAILETGQQHDDPRFHRAAYLRVGFGYGHDHHDALDLQVVAHGMPATIDGGQRPGYSTPGDRSTWVHNVVKVGDADNWGHSWVKALSDAEGARYALAELMPPGEARRYLRQIALVDVEEGEGSKPLPVELCRPGSRLPPVARTASSYVFDVVRVSGGAEHSYLFHAGIDDEFTWSVREAVPAAGDAYLRAFRPDGRNAAGKGPGTLVATWRQLREPQPGVVGGGSERHFLGESFDPASPRKFTRLHLFDVDDCTVYKAQAFCKQWSYQYTCTLTRRQGPSGLESAFAAIVEPYAGEPFLSEARAIPVPGNEADALRAVAIEVKTAGGRTDLCFADGRPERMRDLAGFRVAGEFAYFSRDAEGFRQAALTGGTLLEGPGVRVAVSERERTGAVERVDYARKTLWIDSPWPAREGEGVFEIGLPGHMTTYTATRVRPEGKGAAITVRGGADYLRSPIRSIDEKTGVVTCALGPALGRRPGIDKHWVASDDEATKFWRAEYLDNQAFRLDGAPVSKEDFGPAGVLRLWEYGRGDRVRQSTFASVRRVEPGVFEVQGDADISLSLGGATALEVSRDRAAWRLLSAGPEGILKPPQLAGGPVFVRAAR